MNAAIYTLMLAVLVAPAAGAAPASTWYVRPDGGSSVQCDGRHDAPYPGRGRRQACAWRHPFDALPPGGPARIAGGDTLVIGSGSYPMGRGAPGTEALEKCRAQWPWDCHAAAIPSGPAAAQPTRILGAGFDNGCRKAPELWGSERASTVLDLEGSSNVEVACLEITDHSSCIEFHNVAHQPQRCERDKPPFGAWAAAGINAADSSNVRLADLYIHGLAHDGIRAGRLRDWTLERVRLVANGWSGWSGDIGGATSSNDGRLVFRNVEIAWNGCGETWPQRRHFGCWGQETGGYGDGLGTAATGGDWLFDHVDVHHNTQDGIDLLHANSGARVVFRNVHAEANAGNQVKAAGNVTVENSNIVGSCAALGGRDGLGADDLCRAAGNSIALNLGAGDRATISDNEIRGEGDCLIGLECAGGDCGGASAVVDANRLTGTLRRDLRAPPRPPCPIWIGPELQAARIQFSGNTLKSTRALNCAKNVQCLDNSAR